MNEGQELLLKVINLRLKSLKDINKDDIICDGVNLVLLVKTIEENNDHFANVNENIIDYVINNSNIKEAKKFKYNALKLRDLLIGKRDYKLNIEMTNEYKSIIRTFTRNLNKILNDKVPGVIDVESTEASIGNLYKCLQDREIINDFDLIEELVKNYDEINFDINMIKVMKYVNEHNLGILKTPKKNAPIFDINFIRKPKLDDKILEILDKLDISYKDLPNYLVSELKKCDVDDVYNTYSVIKQNKAEDGGILHLMKKENPLARLIIILYGSETSIKSVINSIKDAKHNVDINILKILINNVMTCFLSKNNEYFKPRYEDYIKNMTMLKELNINYKSLINKTPLFVITDNEVLEYTLKYLENLGADRKLVINRCYKTLAVKPALIIENIDILKKYNVNLKEYFSENNKNYNLLKTDKLHEEILYILDNSKKLDPTNLDYDMLNKYIVNRIYKAYKE